MTTVSYDPRDPAYWRRMICFHRREHGRHLAAAHAARLAGDRQQAAYCLRQAIISRNLLVIFRDYYAHVRRLDHA